MPIFTNPEIQKFIEQQTGVNPVEAVRERLPARFTEGVGSIQYPRGTPIGYQAGQSMYDALEHKQFLKPLGNYMSTLGRDSGRSALIAALALGAGGAGFGALTGRNPVTWGLAGAGVGALGGYGASQLVSSLANRRRQLAHQNVTSMNSEMKRQQEETENPPFKTAAYYGEGDAMTYIQSHLFADPSMGLQDKAALISSLQSVPPQQLSSLASIIRMAGGAAVGYLVSRFLLNLGSTGQLVGSLAGGVVGSMMGNRLPMNAFGDRVDTQHDLFGRQRSLF